MTQAREVHRAVARGRRLADPRLRTAAVDVARTIDPGPANPARRQAWVFLVVMTGLAVIAVVRARWSVVPICWLVELTLWEMWRADAPRRAIARNSRPD